MSVAVKNIIVERKCKNGSWSLLGLTVNGREYRLGQYFDQSRTEESTISALLDYFSGFELDHLVPKICEGFNQLRDADARGNRDLWMEIPVEEQLNYSRDAKENNPHNPIAG